MMREFIDRPQELDVLPEPDVPPRPDIPPEPEDNDLGGENRERSEQYVYRWAIYVLMALLAYFGICSMMFYLKYYHYEEHEFQSVTEGLIHGANFGTNWQMSHLAQEFLIDLPISDTVQSETCREEWANRTKECKKPKCPAIVSETDHFVCIHDNFAKVRSSCEVFEAKKVCEELTKLYGPPGDTKELYSGGTFLKFKRNGTYVYQDTCIDSFGRESLGFPVVVSSSSPYTLNVDMENYNVSATVVKSDYHGLQDAIFHHHPSVNSSNFEEQNPGLFKIIVYTFDGHSASQYIGTFGLHEPEVFYSDTPKVDGYDREGIKKHPKQEEAIIMFLRNLVMHGMPLTINPSGYEPTEITQVVIVAESANDIFKSLTKMTAPIAGIYILKYPENFLMLQGMSDTLHDDMQHIWEVLEAQQEQEAILERLKMSAEQAQLVNELLKRRAEQENNQKILEEFDERNTRMFKDFHVGRRPAHP